MIWIWNFLISYPWRNILIDIDFIRKINKKVSIIKDMDIKNSFLGIYEEMEL